MFRTFKHREPTTTIISRKGRSVSTSSGDTHRKGTLPPLRGKARLANTLDTSQSQLSRPMPSRHLICMESRRRSNKH